MNRATSFAKKDDDMQIDKEWNETHDTNNTDSPSLPFSPSSSSSSSSLFSGNGNEEKGDDPWLDFIDTTYQRDVKEYDMIEDAALDFVPAWEQAANHVFIRESNDGDVNMQTLLDTLYLLDTLGFERSDAQRKFHAHFIAATLQHIYKEDLYRNLDAILRRFNLEKIRSNVLICTPRRWGKTFSVALFCAAYIWSQPKAIICIYSTGKRASKAMLMLIFRMVASLASAYGIVGHGWCETYNLQECRLKVNNIRGSIGEVASYPSKIEVSFPPFLIFLFLCIAHKNIGYDTDTDIAKRVVSGERKGGRNSINQKKIKRERFFFIFDQHVVLKFEKKSVQRFLRHFLELCVS